MKNKKNSENMVDYMGTKMPASWFEKSEGGKKKATTIVRRRQPSLQEQIQSMLRFHHDRENQIDEDFSDGNDYNDQESRSPHELVRDEETGIEMTRYEKAMLDQERPRMEEEALKRAVDDARRKAPKKNRPDPAAKRGQPDEPAAGEEDDT